MSEHIVDITLENAQSHLIDESFTRLVVVDFWAEWCAPCKDLMPILEKLAVEYGGQFLLAKVNADQLHMLATQFGVRSLPTVLLMKDGQPIDGFSGAQSEVEVRKLLEKHLPKPWDLQHATAQELIAAEQPDAALPLLREALAASSDRADIACTLAEACILTKRFKDAENALKKVWYVDQDARFEKLKAELELARAAQKAPEISALEAQLAASPEDAAVIFALAAQYSQHKFYEEALSLLFDLLRKDMNAEGGEVKKTFLDILAVLGKGDPLAADYQRKLYTLLY